MSWTITRSGAWFGIRRSEDREFIEEINSTDHHCRTRRLLRYRPFVHTLEQRYRGCEVGGYDRSRAVQVVNSSARVVVLVGVRQRREVENAHE